MTANDPDLGSHLGTHPAAGGFTGFQNSAFGRTLLLTLAGVALGFIPGLLVALVADFVLALLIGPVVVGALAYLWARKQTQVAAVTEARIHERGVVLVDGRGTHSLAWGDIVAIAGRQVQNVGSTPVGEFKGALTSSYQLQTSDGTLFWLDDRIQNVANLAATLARGAGVTVMRLA